MEMWAKYTNQRSHLLSGDRDAFLHLLLLKKCEEALAIKYGYTLLNHLNDSYYPKHKQLKDMFDTKFLESVREESKVWLKETRKNELILQLAGIKE